MEGRARRPWRRRGRGMPALASPLRKRGRERAHGMVEVQAELEAEAIDEWRCGGGAGRRRVVATACGGERSCSACCCSSEWARERGGEQGIEWMEGE
jgi:hypothetical protein